MTPPAIIAFGYKRERGKDTAANYVNWVTCETVYPYIHDSFSFSLKEGIGKTIFGFSDVQLNGYLKEEYDSYWKLTPRDVLQRAGTEAMRNTFGEDFWVRTLLRRVAGRSVGTVISDLRFRSEAEQLKRVGALLIKIDRDIAFAAHIDKHQSEVDLDGYDGWDYVIDNNSNRVNLYHKIHDILLKVGLRLPGSRQLELPFSSVDSSE